MKFLDPFGDFYAENYEQAKLKMVRLWTPWDGRPQFGAKLLPICAVCLKPIRMAPAAHHAVLGRFYQWAYRGLWNIAPVHQQPEGDCHDVAHGGYRGLIIQRLYYIVGKGNVVLGRQMIAALLARDMRGKVELPEVKENPFE